MSQLRRFEYTDAKSNKFWEVSVAEATVTVRYGRIGTDGQTQVKSYESTAEAMAAAEKQIAEKVKKGYREIG
jgi:predicted DNA-binding WGR domain protein